MASTGSLASSEFDTKSKIEGELLSSPSTVRLTKWKIEDECPSNEKMKLATERRNLVDKKIVPFLTGLTPYEGPKADPTRIDSDDVSSKRKFRSQRKAPQQNKRLKASYEETEKINRSSRVAKLGHTCEPPQSSRQFRTEKCAMATMLAKQNSDGDLVLHTHCTFCHQYRRAIMFSSIIIITVLVVSNVCPTFFPTPSAAQAHLDTYFSSIYAVTSALVWTDVSAPIYQVQALFAVTRWELANTIVPLCQGFLLHFEMLTVYFIWAVDWTQHALTFTWNKFVFIWSEFVYALLSLCEFVYALLSLCED